MGSPDLVVHGAPRHRRAQGLHDALRVVAVVGVKLEADRGRGDRCEGAAGEGDAAECEVGRGIVAGHDEHPTTPRKGAANGGLVRCGKWQSVIGALYALPGGLVAEVVSYDDGAKRWLARSGHYLDNPPPGCLLCVAVRRAAVGLCDVEIAEGPMLGLCLLGRPSARALPQDGSMAEVTRFVLAEGLPHGTASALLRAASKAARARGVGALISYHDRTRHTGCIYRKAGFRRDGTVEPRTSSGWASRAGRKAVASQGTPKRRWRLDLGTAAAE